MTRINATVPPSNLSDQHLLGELHEIGRVSTLYKYRVENGIPFNDIPIKFRLGAGHVKFFFDKHHVILRRVEMLLKEMYNRGFKSNMNTQYMIDNFRTTGKLIENVYMFTPEDQKLIEDRIISMLPDKPRYYSKEVSKEFMINLIRQ